MSTAQAVARATVNQACELVSAMGACMLLQVPNDGSWNFSSAVSRRLHIMVSYPQARLRHTHQRAKTLEHCLTHLHRVATRQRQ